MENKHTGLIAIIVILILMVGGLTAYIIYDKNNQQNNNDNTSDESTISDNDIYGFFYTDEPNKVGLTLNSDNTATYEDSCDLDGEMTGGVFKRSGNTITYTKLYDNYGDTNNGPYEGDEPKVITFTIIDKNTIKQETESCGHGAILKRVDY